MKKPTSEVECLIDEKVAARVLPLTDKFERLVAKIEEVVAPFAGPQSRFNELWVPPIRQLLKELMAPYEQLLAELTEQSAQLAEQARQLAEQRTEIARLAAELHQITAEIHAGSGRRLS
jgi:septal ring factor EnvC (AmiA/AmiB activator)